MRGQRPDTSPFQEYPRNETTLFTSFTSADMAKAVSAKDMKKIEAKLDGKKVEKADFATPKAYTWFRVAAYSCFNPNTTEVADPAQPPGFAIGQMELFGVSTAKGAARPMSETAQADVKREVAETVKPPAFNVPFIISYWVGPPKSETTLARYKEIAECGFNVAYPAENNLWAKNDKEQDAHNKKYLDLCRQAGLKAFLWDGNVAGCGGFDKAPTPEEIPQIEKTLDGMIARHSSHPAFLGFVLGDEGNTAEGNKRLGVVNQYLLRKDPTHLPYYNLLPNYAQGFVQGPAGGYDRFIADYIRDAKPAFVSWDHYRQMFEGGDENYYWNNLEIVRKHCLKAKIPYNQIIVSFRHMGYRECSEADLRWQVYTSLAYGSRGIQYFTYWFVPGLAWADAPALISKEGKRDVKWEYVKKINHRIAKLGPTLVNLTSTGAYCNDPLPPGARRLNASAEAPVIEGEGGPLLVGCFTDPDGKQYVFPVNRSFSSRITARLTMAEKFVFACELSQETGKPLPAVSVKRKALEVRLEPGEGRLFLLK